MGLFRLLVLISAPISISKTIISLIQLSAACVNVGIVDVSDRINERAKQDKWEMTRTTDRRHHHQKYCVSYKTLCKIEQKFRHSFLMCSTPIRIVYLWCWHSFPPIVIVTYVWNKMCALTYAILSVSSPSGRLWNAFDWKIKLIGFQKIDSQTCLFWFCRKASLLTSWGLVAM